MIRFLIFYLLVLLVGGIVIAGWYGITRGSWERTPDDKLKFKGKIFKGWLKFFDYHRTIYGMNNATYYSGRALRELMLKMEISMGISTFTTMPEKKYSFSEEDKCIFLGTPNLVAYFNERFFAFGYQNDVSMRIEKNNNGESARVYFLKHKKQYRFPEWIRKPLATCIYCFGSLYGSIVWWVIANISIHLPYFRHYPLWVFWAFWVPYCISLSIIAPWIWKKMN